MADDKLRIVCVEFENLEHFENGRFKVDFVATDRVLKDSNLRNISSNIFSQRLLGFVGLNATGKTTALRFLKIALSVVIYNADLTELCNNNRMIGNGSIMRVTFFYRGFYYQLESQIRSRRFGDGRLEFYYAEEVLKSKKALTVKSRNDLLNFSDDICNEIKKRSELQKEKADYLDDSKSIISPLVRNNGSFVSDNLFLNYANIAKPLGEIPSEILNLFDDSIESLDIGEDTFQNNQSAWRLKFKNINIAYSSPESIALNFIISTGTISGQELIRKAIYALKSGGYLIVDELEMHLNKEIVKVILNLFKSAKTNPNGACLIFSIHYAELLDSDSLSRKDNIYIMRKKQGLMSVSKFSDEFKRNDFKKSQLILSNALGGTAPKYETIQRLRDFVCKQL